MGVGKTTTSKKLLKLLPNCVMLDGDWCWYADPWTVTDETKQMMYNNTSYLLNNFLNCSAYDNIIFCWVMHFEFIIKDILSLITNKNYNLYIFSLVCSEEALKMRLQKDVDDGVRDHVIFENLMSRMPNYYQMKTVKIDVSDITSDTAADIIYKHIHIYEIVKQTIDEWDSYGFLAMGAPRGEYDTESLMITQLITEESSVDELQGVISKVFSQMFGPEYFPVEKCRNIAEKLKENIIQGRII